MSKKPVVMITFKENGNNGGPYNSHYRIMNSSLRKKYEFVPLLIPEGRLGIVNFKLLSNLKKQIDEVKPDMIHITGLQLEGFHVTLASKLAGISNLILAIHGSSMEALYFKKWKKAILNVLEILTLKLAKVTYGVSEYVSNWSRVKKYSNRHYGYIYNLPDLEEERLEKVSSIREELNIDQSDVVIVSTGRITIEKGYEVLIDSIIKGKRNSNVKYLIVGYGDYYETMQKKVQINKLEDKVFMLGYRSDIESILSESDIYVTCTLHETLGNSILEACKYSLPIVATNVGGIPEIVINEYNGFLIPANNIKLVSEKLENLILHPETRISMGEKSKKILDEKFRREKILIQIDELYKSVLND